MMIKFLISLSIFLLFISCSNNSEDSLRKKMYPDSANYEYLKLNNDLVKIIRFFPNTKDTSAIYFLNKNNYRDSTAYYYYRNGNIKDIIKYEDSMTIRKCKRYYKIGTIKRESIIYKDSFFLGDDKYYYENGKLKAIQEFIIYKDSIEHLNNERYFDKQGKIIKDSTYFFKIITSKDTISFNDSLKVRFNVIKPKSTKAFAFHGSVNDYFGNKKWADSLVLRDSIFYFRPKKLGKNKIEIVFVVLLEPDNKLSPYLKIFLKKGIFVTE